MSSIIKSLPGFGSLSESEAEIFESAAQALELPAGSEVPALDHVVLLTRGALSVEVQATAGWQQMGMLEPGGLHGETNLFERTPIELRVQAASEAACLSWSLQGLKNAFRYSRTGAAKLMGIFSVSLSRKIRWANELLRRMPDSELSPGIRPREIDAIDLARLRSFSAPRDYESDAVIFEEGDQGGELFIIAEGTVEILKATNSGERMALARLTAGDFFGEMAFVDESARSATAIAKTPLHVHVLPAGSLERIFDYNVGTGLVFTNVVCKIMSRRLDATLRRIAS